MLERGLLIAQHRERAGQRVEQVGIRRVLARKHCLQLLDHLRDHPGDLGLLRDMLLVDLVRLVLMAFELGEPLGASI